MISVNDYLSLDVDGIEILDQRTLNALNLNANIYTIKDLLFFCSNDHEYKLSTIKGIGLNGIKIINNLLKYIASKGIELPIDDSMKDNKEILIEQTISESNLNLYSSYLTIRTVNALNFVGINKVQELIKNKDISLRGVRGLGKSGLKEIDNFLNYIINNFSIKPIENISDYDLLDIVDDIRILQVLGFNGIKKMSELEKFLESKEKFQELRYLNDKDYIFLKAMYDGLYKNDEKKITLADNFLNVLNNLSDDEKIIFNERILGSLTLIEVGNKIGITRERVRQKQKIIENIIQDNSNLFINQNTDLLFKINNTIKIHNYVFFPNEIKLFDYLGFNENNSNLLYLFLKGIDGLKGEVIDNKIFCILTDDNILNSEDLSNIYLYLNKRLKNNNDDILLEDLFYEIILEKILSQKIDYMEFKEYIINYFKKIIELQDDYVINQNIIHRFNKKYKLEDYIEMVLEKFPDGLHYSEINSKINDIYKEEYNDRQVNTGLCHFGLKFINIGLGIYTLKSNNSYSGEKVKDIIFLYLKNEGIPKTLQEITKYVLSRKKVGEKTVLAAIGGYKNENRFVFYKDGKIGLKEWGLANERKKKEISEYEISVSKAYDILREKNLIPNSFSSKELIEILYFNFGNKISQNTGSIYTLLKNKEKKLEITVKSNGNNNIYSLIK